MQWFRLRYAYLILFATFVATVAASVYMYNDGLHSHAAVHEGQVYQKDDVVADFYHSLNRDGREKVVCYRESHKNFYLFTFQLVLFILFVSVYAVITKVRLSARLRKQNGEVQAQKDELDVKNQAILSSIRYAQRVQNSLLPSHTLLRECIGEHVLYFKPKDIVSGDFYWTGHNRHGHFICVADCTGHGVPGAFLASIGSNTLTQVLTDEVLLPSDLIYKLNQAFYAFLSNNSDDGFSDGMEISCLMIDAEDGKTHFAGSRSRVIIVSPSGQLDELRGGKTTIGHQKNTQFKSSEVIALPGSWIYLCTDGVTDQFGGELGKKLQRSGLKNWLIAFNHLEVIERNTELGSAIEYWKADQSQIDDMLLFGFQLDQTPNAVRAKSYLLPEGSLQAV